jgi:hypothetical protein
VRARGASAAAEVNACRCGAARGCSGASMARCRCARRKHTWRR